MTKRQLFLTLLVSNISIKIYSQAVGIGSSSFTPGGMLEVRGTGATSATTNLILSNSTPTTMLTVLNNGNINVPTSTAAGLGVFTSNSNRYIHNYGTEGFFAGVNAGNFTHTSEGSLGIGYSALAALTTGWYNTALGANAMGTAIPGHRNTAIGYNALKPNTQAANTAIGAHAMEANSGGDANTVIGAYAYKTSTSGTENVAIGFSSIATGNTTGDYNTMVGSYTGEDLSSGGYNVGLGGYAMLNTTSGSHNVAIGGYALSTMTGGDGNVAIGRTALGNAAVGSNNVAIGYEAGKVNTGNRNVFIGHLAGDAEVGSDKLYIATNGNNLICGDFSSKYVSIGTTTVSYPLYIKHTTNETVVVESDNTTSTAISVKNTSAGGHDFQFYSTGSGNTAGRFGIWDNTAGKTWLNLSGTTGDYTVVSGAVIGFSSSATQAGTAADLGISRVGAGVLAVGTGAAGSYAGILVATNVGIGTNNPAEALDVVGSMALPVTTSTVGIIKINGVRYLHSYGGSQNLFVGSAAGNFTMTGVDNVGLGKDNLSALTSGFSNTAVGSVSLKALTDGDRNVSVGYRAADGVTTGNDNTSIGNASGITLVGGVQNTFLGSSADASAAGLNNTVAIGYNAVVGTSNHVVIGNTNHVYWGLGKTTQAVANSVIENVVNTAHLTSGGTWTNTSDRNLKTNIVRVNTVEILNKVADLEISTWNYKNENDSIFHIGPMAQDFYKLFGTGGSNTYLSTIDPSGVALAAVQELLKQMNELRAENYLLRKRMEQIENGILRTEALQKR